MERVINVNIYIKLIYTSNFYNKNIEQILHLFDVFIIEISYLFMLKKDFNPLNSAMSPSSSSILNNWLYLATLSLLAGAPVLI